ncbi:MAG: hypothetical protein H6Q67_7 [Firmicutes bacterium]|nr:hypothetical protein [Bacillota bacterium]
MRVGLFGICGFQKDMEAEGIGRFMVRLTEGLLSVNKHLEVFLVTDSLNSMVPIFSYIKSIYGNRLNFIVSNDVQWTNDNIAVDIWIVPYVVLPKALELRKPYIACLHDLGHIHFSDGPQDETSQKYTQYLNAVASKVTANAIAVVCNSNYVRECEGLQFLKLPRTKVTVIRLASPSEEYSHFGLLDEEIFRKKYDLVYPYIVYPSAIRFYKNHQRLIEAFINYRNSAECNHPKLFLVLTDSSSSYSKVHDASQFDSIDPEIRLSILFSATRFPAHEIPSLYHYAAATIIPTLFEGKFPSQILESLIMNTPVAFSNIPVTWELATPGEGVISFNPYSVDEIQRAIGQLLKNRENLIGQQVNAFATILSRTWKDVAQEYFELIQEILR